MFRILRRAGTSFKQFMGKSKYSTAIQFNRPLFFNIFGRLIPAAIFAGTLLTFTGGLIAKQQLKVNSLYD
jgi:hypothetical protein